MLVEKDIGGNTTDILLYQNTGWKLKTELSCEVAINEVLC